MLSDCPRTSSTGTTPARTSSGGFAHTGCGYSWTSSSGRSRGSGKKSMKSFNAAQSNAVAGQDARDPARAAVLRTVDTAANCPGSAGSPLGAGVREPVAAGAGLDDVPSEGEPVDDGGAEPRVGEGLTGLPKITGT